MSRSILTVLVVVCLPCLVIAQQQESCDVRLTYVANEGVLIETANTTIIIDGLHEKYRDAYAFLPGILQKQLENAEEPFDEIDLIFVSHVHRDHFSAKAITTYLKNNKTARLVSSPQVIDSVRVAEPLTTATAVSLDKSTSMLFNGNDVTIQFLPLPHGSGRFKWIQNLGHLIQVSGKTILHVGDAEMDQRNFAVLDLVDKSVDVAILPYWYLTSSEGKRIIKNEIRPLQLVAAHIPPNNQDNIRDEIVENFPTAVTFTDMLESQLTLPQNCHN